MVVFSIISAICLSFGISYLIVGNQVKKSNDIGDSKGEFQDFSSTNVQYICQQNARRSELDNFIRMYGNTREWR